MDLRDTKDDHNPILGPLHQIHRGNLSLCIPKSHPESDLRLGLSGLVIVRPTSQRNDVTL